MKIRERLARLILGKEFVHSALISNLFESTGWHPTNDPQNLIKKIRGWSYTCITKNATACAQTPLRLYTTRRPGMGSKKYKSEKVQTRKQDFLRRKLAERVAGAYELEEVIEHPLLDLLRSVNKYQNAFDLKLQSFQYLESIASAFWWKERGVGGKIINIWPLIAQRVQIIPDAKNGIKEFKYGSGDKAKHFKPEDIVHFKYTSLTDPFGGDSPLAACEQSVDLDDYMNRFEIASFKNGGRPSTILEVPADGCMDPKERKRIETEFRNKYSGVDKQGKFLVTTGGAKLTEFGFSPKEMSFTKGRDYVLQSICGAFGVPMSFVKVQDISRANLWGSLIMWMQFTINPKLVMFEQKLNEQFTPEWGEDLYLLFDDARPVDSEQRLKEIQTHLTNKYTSINEEREIDGLEPVDWGKAPVEPEPVNPPETPEPEDEGKQPEPKKVKREGPRNLPPEPDLMPVIFRTQLTIMFKELEAEVIKNINNYNKALIDLVTKDTAEDLASAIFNKQKWEGKLEAEMMPFIKGILVQGIIDTLEKLQPGAVYNSSSPEVLRALDERKGAMKSIIASTQDEIRQMIKDGIDAGESRSQLIKRIRDNFDARSKADRVVRTESIWAHNEGTMQAWRQSGVVSAKKWDSSTDSRTCPFCAAMEGKIVGVDENYHSKGDSLTVVDPETKKEVTLNFKYEEVKHPPLHPNCRCSIIPILLED